MTGTSDTRTYDTISSTILHYQERLGSSESLVCITREVLGCCVSRKTITVTNDTRIVSLPIRDRVCIIREILGRCRAQNDLCCHTFTYDARVVSQTIRRVAAVVVCIFWEVCVLGRCRRQDDHWDTYIAYIFHQHILRIYTVLPSSYLEQFL